MRITDSPKIPILWWVALTSAFIGSFSHVLIDSIMHYDVEPYFTFTQSNPFWGMVSVAVLHKFCVYSGIVGGLIYYAIRWRYKNA